LSIEKGESVTLPDWFQALNRDLRYPLTTIGTFAQAMISEKIKNNRFVIKTNVPGTEVSWLVTGIRKDPYANKHRIPVEEMKTESERGFYLHPDGYDQAEEKGVITVHNRGLKLELQRTKTQAEQSKSKGSSARNNDRS
jgi:hypothetical protein